MFSAKIKINALIQPSALIVFYLTGLSFTFIFVERVGQSTIIDELLLIAMFPMALIGVRRGYLSMRTPLKLIFVYFYFAAVSSWVALATRGEIPFLAPILGMMLDAKFIIFLGALMYLAQQSKSSSEEMVINVCKVIVYIGFLNSIFFLRDVFSNGTSISGIRLDPSSIFGYVPIGLFSHKLYAAALGALSFSSAVVLYLFSKHLKYLAVAILFLLIILLASSMKELGVLVAVFIVVARALNNKKSKISRGSKNLLLVSVFIFPVGAFLFGSAIDELITTRINAHFFQENVRSVLHIKSAQIATDYFPLGSGAGTFSSQPSRTMYYSPLYYEYGIHYYYGASEHNSSFLMDAGWPKFIAEAGWFGGGAYFIAYLYLSLSMFFSCMREPTPINVFGVMIGSIVFLSAMGSAVFTGNVGLMLCAILFFCHYLNVRKEETPCGDLKAAA